VRLDLFTDILRWICLTIFATFFLLFVGFLVGGIVMVNIRKWQVKHHHKVYDWMRDGECVPTEDMYPRCHVSVPDGVPKEWLK
jgi:hypothetical protein